MIEDIRPGLLSPTQRDDYVFAMVYGKKIEFAAAFATVTELAETMMQQRGVRNIVIITIRPQTECSRYRSLTESGES